MDLQITSMPSFYYQIIFILIIGTISIILSKYLRKLIAKKKVASQEIFKLVLLGIYVHIEPLLFYLLCIVLLSIGYFISILQTENIGLICIVQIILGLVFLIKLIVSIIKR